MAAYFGRRMMRPRITVEQTNAKSVKVISRRWHQHFQFSTSGWYLFISLPYWIFQLNSERAVEQLSKIVVCFESLIFNLLVKQLVI